MSRIRRCLHNTFPAFVYRKLKERYYEKVTLPAATEAELAGIKFDIAGLPPQMKEVILKGFYEWPEVAICRDLIEPGECILELGGAIGFVGLFCLKNLQAAKVVSVEPNSGTIDRLRRNYKLNSLSANVIQAAIAAKDGTLHFNVSPYFWTDSISRDSKQSANTIEVQALSIQSILNKAGDGFTALILDVEGAEQWLDWRALPSSVTKIVLEIHPSILGLAEAYRVLQSALNCGFEVAAKHEQVFGLVRRQKV
jgi:FkbM family methyltransferase